uniref:HECT-type E3 ubiquitin transferase n=1 Tax=Myxobolus squamalis TaxID=59785 RepID=A0A6B2FZU3_MYXSQ
MEYVNLIVEWSLDMATFLQMQTIKTAFYEVIPYPWLAFFSGKELKSFLCGVQSYDIENWKRNTIYSCGYKPKSPQCIWFWQFVEKSNEKTRAKLIKFVTGSTNIPVSGFGDLYCSSNRKMFTIEKWNKPHHLPTGHTCFNRIDLPPYSSYEELETKLLLAIDECSGFHVE